MHAVLDLWRLLFSAFSAPVVTLAGTDDSVTYSNTLPFTEAVGLPLSAMLRKKISLIADVPRPHVYELPCDQAFWTSFF